MGGGGEEERGGEMGSPGFRELRGMMRGRGKKKAVR